jgi:hypothetical protein
MQKLHFLTMTLVSCFIAPVHVDASSKGFVILPAESSVDYGTSVVARIEVNKLGVPFPGGEVTPTDEFYLVQVNKNGYPIIFGDGTGFDVNLSLADLDGDRQKELLVKYKSGGNQTILDIYYFNEDRLVKANGESLASNTGFIEIESVVSSGGSVIDVKNSDFDERDHQMIKWERFYYNGNQILKQGDTNH